MRKPGRNRHHEKGFQSRFLIGFEVLYCVLSSLHIVPKVELDKTNIFIVYLSRHIVGTASEYKTTAIAKIVCSSTAEYMPSVRKTPGVSPNSETEIRKFRSRESNKESAGRVCAFLLYLESLFVFVGVSMLRMCAVFVKPERAWIP